MEDNTIKISHILFMILMMGIIIVVGTYAWLSYRSNDTAMVLTIGEINNVQVTLSPYQFKGSLLPQVTYTGGDYTSVTAVNNSSSERNIRLYYRINSIDTELISSDFKYTIERSTDGTTYNEYTSGNFNGTSNGSELTILEESIPGNNTTYQYKVYLWIDGSNSGQSYMQGRTFDGELRATIAENQYQITLDPNGGTYNGVTQSLKLVKNHNSYYGLQTPTRNGYTFNGWTISGTGTLLRGNANGDGNTTTSGGISLAKTIMQDSDASQYTNYKYTDASVTSNTWPALKYPHYSYILGHTYRISLDIRLNAYKNIVYIDVRHAFKDNDWYTGYGLVYTRIPITAVGQGWIHYTMDRTWDTSKRTVVVSGTTYEFDVDPLLEIYTAINANNTGSVDFDIKNIIIEDITNNTQISTDTYNGYIYKVGNGNGTLTAIW